MGNIKFIKKGKVDDQTNFKQIITNS